MAKVAIFVSRPIMLGLGQSALRLKPGKAEIDDTYLDKWYVKAMIDSGTITLASVPKSVVVDESKLAEVVIAPESISVALPKSEPKEVEDIAGSELPAVDFTPDEDALPKEEPAKVAKPKFGKTVKIDTTIEEPKGKTKISKIKKG